jgi:glyoxylase-like metal-dependent hydrolase (beta-lactamase superfamily II)
MKPVEVQPHLYRIPLCGNIDGLEGFIGSWVFDGDVTFIVDVGPKTSLFTLLEGLQELGMKRIDFIFLSHVHIDHAGATGSLITHFPEAKVICHPLGITHLVDPQRLWEGSKKVLGELALKYGEIDPVPEENLLSSEEFEWKDFRIILTPGHATHHLSVLHRHRLFAGEAGGIFLDLGDEFYLRPPTPPRFILEEAVGSIDKLLNARAQDIYYAHAGFHRDANKMLTLYREQLFLWRDVVAEQMKKEGENDLIDRCIFALLERDKLFKNLRLVKNEKHKVRELNFTCNSLKGFIDYLSPS